MRKVWTGTAPRGDGNLRHLYNIYMQRDLIGYIVFSENFGGSAPESARFPQSDLLYLVGLPCNWSLSRFLFPSALFQSKLYALASPSVPPPSRPPPGPRMTRPTGKLGQPGAYNVGNLPAKRHSRSPSPCGSTTGTESGAAGTSEGEASAGGGSRTAHHSRQPKRSRKQAAKQKASLVGARAAAEIVWKTRQTTP